MENEGWIRLSSLKPSYHHLVLLAVEGFDRPIIAERRPFYGCDSWVTDHGKIIYYKITHWMELPSMPKGGKE
jgi:hypothetical protein